MNAAQRSIYTLTLLVFICVNWHIKYNAAIYVRMVVDETETEIRSEWMRPSKFDIEDKLTSIYPNQGPCNKNEHQNKGRLQLFLPLIHSLLYIVLSTLKAFRGQRFNRTHRNEQITAVFSHRLCVIHKSATLRHVPPRVLLPPSPLNSSLEPIRVEGRGPCRGSGEPN